MRKLIPFVFTAFLLITAGLYFLGHDPKITKRSLVAKELVSSSMSDLANRLLYLERTTCVPNASFQSCLDANVDKLVITPPGQFAILPFELNSDQTLLISKDTILKLSDAANMPRWGGFVLGMFGAENVPVQGIVVILEGVIDGNNAVHSYDKSGNECIRIDYGKNIFVVGRGLVQNCSGDGVDIDASSLIYLHGIRSYLNSGAGFHIGSGRPIRSSKDVIGVAIEAKGNGFVVGRAGIDSSWPNSNSVTYLFSESQDNYRNWELAGAGSLALLNLSGKSSKMDLNLGATHVLINDELHSSFVENIMYYFSLLRRDFARLRGKTQPDFLINLPYLRDER